MRPDEDASRQADDLVARFEREALPHLDTVLRFAIQLTGHSAKAEDLTQEVFLKAFSAFGRFEAGTNVRAWLLTILRNVNIDQHRREKARPAVALDPVGAADPPAPPEPATRVDRDDFDEAVAAELDGLQPEFRQALLLCDVEGLSYQEIAAVMGCPVGTVRSRIARARAVLRERLEAHANELGLTTTPEQAGHR